MVIQLGCGGATIPTQTCLIPELMFFLVHWVVSVYALHYPASGSLCMLNPKLELLFPVHCCCECSLLSSSPLTHHFGSSHSFDGNSHSTLDFYLSLLNIIHHFCPIMQSFIYWSHLPSGAGRSLKEELMPFDPSCTLQEWLEQLMQCGTFGHMRGRWGWGRKEDEKGKN